MAVPIPRHVSGEQVRLALMSARPAGLPKADLIAATSLTESQVSNGLLWIRLVAAAEHLTPLTWTRRDGYRFSDDPADWVSYERSQLLRLLTGALRTVKGTLDPHLVRQPDDPFAVMASKNLAATIVNLEAVTRKQ